MCRQQGLCYACHGDFGSNADTYPVGYRSNLSDIQTFCRRLFGCDISLAIQNDYRSFLVRNLDKGKVSPIYHLSPGMKLYASLLDIASRRTVPQVLLVDDIECLHPEWQVEYMHMIDDLFPTTQVITVTNSSYIWDAHYPWERFLMLPPADPRNGNFERLSDSDDEEE
jgi:hypothetical protein